MIMIIIIAAVYYILTRLIYSSPTPVRFTIISIPQMRKVRPEGYATYPRLLSLVIRVRNFNFKPMLLITASPTGASGCNQRKMVNAWEELRTI